MLALRHRYLVLTVVLLAAVGVAANRVYFHCLFKAQREACRLHLEQIGALVAQFSALHAGRTPTTLDELLPLADQRRLYRCKADPRYASEETPFAEWTSYVILRNQEGVPSPGDTFLIADRSFKWHGHKGINVLTSTGQVVWLSSREWAFEGTGEDIRVVQRQ